MARSLLEILDIADTLHDLTRHNGGYVRADDFKAVIREALAGTSKFNVVVGGGLAVAVHGFARATRDIDLVIRVPFRKIRQVMEDRGFQFDSTISFGKQGRIHLFEKSGAGVDFLEFDDDSFYEHILKRAETSELFGFQVKVMSLEDLIVTKLLSYRSKDQIDLLELLKKKPDESYLKKWIHHFNLTARFQEISEKL